MKYKTFKNSGLSVSCLASGTWAMGGRGYGEIDHQEAIDAIRKMVELGVNLIDTAPCYGWGASEKLVGEAIQTLDRSKIILSTKCGLINTPYQDPIMGRDSSFKNIIREVEASLYNLQTEYIDIYFIHWPDPKTPIAETMSALNLLKSQGKIRHIGVSNFSIEQIEEAMQYGQIDVQQPPYSMVNQKATELMEWGYAHGIDSLTYGSLGSGILSGAIRKLPNFDKDDIRMTFYDFYREPKFSKIMKLLETMDVVAANHNASVAQVAINWSSTKDFVGTALVGVNTPQQVMENCAAFDFTLTAEEIATLEHTMKELEIGY